MITPTTPEGMEKWDHLGWPDNVLAAWMVPGRDPEWHARAQDEVRRVMPAVARALDWEAAEVSSGEPRRPRRLRERGVEYPAPPWEEGSDR